MNERIERPPLTGYVAGHMGHMSHIETRARWQTNLMARFAAGDKTASVTHLRLVGDDQDE